jgi:hypothetical protein
MSLTRRLFGPSRQEIWTQLSETIGGRYVGRTFWKGDKVVARHADWVVTLDTYTVSTGKVTVVYTRMRAPFENPAGFRFTVYRKSLFSGLGRLLGMQDLEIGHPPFDHDFVIKANDERRVRALLANTKVRHLIGRQKSIHLSAKNDTLTYQVTGVIKDLERLKLLYELFAETLDQLTRVGGARARTRKTV